MRRGAGFAVAAGLMAAVLTAASCVRADDAKAEIERLLDRYFASWSKPDMEAYRACFHPQATIVYVGRSSPLLVHSLDAFVQSQARAHEMARTPMHEEAVSQTITVDGTLAQATVRYALYKGEQTITGVDCFPLVEVSDGWRIVNLVFRADP
jgi:ketosteroid isomerase-like protein